MLNYPNIVGQDLLSPPLELKCYSNPLAHANFTKPKLDMLVLTPLSKNTLLPNAMLPNVKLFSSFCNNNGRVQNNGDATEFKQSV